MPPRKPAIPTVATVVDHKLIVGRREFGAFIAKQQPIDSELPLTHVTDAYRLRDIVNTQELRPKACDVFNESLLYFFYGRPAYRPGKENQPTAGKEHAPICFIVSGMPKTIRRMFPFDSGAVHNKIVNAQFHPEVRMEDYMIEPDPSTPRRLINLFYGSMEKYLENDPIMGLSLPTFEYEAENYYSILRGENNLRADERATTIEIQTQESMKIGGRTQAAIIPSIFADVPEVAQKLVSAGVEIIPYDYIRRLPANEYTGLFYQLVRQWYRRQAGK